MLAATSTRSVCPPRWSTPRSVDRPTIGPQVERIARSLTFGAGLLPWQRHVIARAGELLPTGRFAYPVVVVVVPRRAGKTLLTLARQLQRVSGLDRHCWYTAQRREDAAKQFRDEWVPVVERANPWKHTLTVRRAQGSEGLKHRSTGSAIQLFPPTASALHGMNADDVTVDEAWFFTADQGADIEAGYRPAQLTRTQRQTWIMSAGGTETSTWLDAWMTAGRAASDEGRSDGLAYFEWSADPGAAGYDPGDEQIWAAAHPALGWTIDIQALREDYATMGREAFERSILNVWPRPSAGGLSGIDAGAWARARTDHRPGAPLVVAVDVARDRGHASIVVAGSGAAAGVCAVQVVEHGEGLEWVVPRLVALRGRLRAARFVIDELVAAAIVADLTRARFPIVTTSAADLMRACGAFVDDVNEGRLTHRGELPLDRAVVGAARRPVGDAWAWSRARSGDVDISPLVAASLAAHAWRSTPIRGKPRVITG